MNANKVLKIILTLVIVVVLIGINPLMTILTNKDSTMRIDLTPGRLLSPSSETKKYLKTVDEKIKVFALTNENFAAHPEIMKLHTIVSKLTSLNKNFEYTIIDLSKEESEQFLAKHQENPNLSIISIIFEKGEESEIIMTDVNMANQNLLDFTSFERKFVNGINALISRGAPEIDIPSKGKVLDSEPIDPMSTVPPDEAVMKAAERNTNIILIIYLALIPLLIFIAGFFLKRKCCCK